MARKMFKGGLPKVFICPQEVMFIIQWDRRLVALFLWSQFPYL